MCGEYSTSIVAEKQLKQHMKILFIKSINGTGVRLEWRKDVNPTAISRAAVYPPAISRTAVLATWQGLYNTRSVNENLSVTL